MNILVLYPRLVYPQIHHGSGIRVLRLLKFLASRGHRVSLACFVGREEVAHVLGARSLENWCREVAIVPKPEPRSLRTRLHHLAMRRQPNYVMNYHSDTMQREIDRLVGAQAIDLVHAEFAYMSQYNLPSSCSTVVNADEPLFRHYSSVLRSGSLRDRRHALVNLLWLKGFELRTYAKFDKVCTVTPHERDLLRSCDPTLDVEVSPGIAGAEFFRPSELAVPSKPTILFTGNFSHVPNVTGAVWFVQRVFPEVERRLRDVRLVIAGANPPAEVRRLAVDRRVEVLGYVEDMRRHLAQDAVFVCPAISGGGLRTKILEAMAAGRPVVSTALGVEGVEATHGKDLMVAHAPDDFADQVVALLGDPLLRRSMGENGREVARRRYHEDVVFSNLESIYAGLMGGRGPRRSVDPPRGASTAHARKGTG